MYVYMYVSSNRVTVPTVATLRYIVLYYMKTGLRSVMQTAAQRYQLHQSIRQMLADLHADYTLF